MENEPSGSLGTLVDSNVLLDLITGDPKWKTWSVQALATAADEGLLIINPIIYAEVSVGFSSVEELDLVLPEEDFVRAALPWAASFLVGKCFAEYRRRGGVKTSPLPDFFIGAHAAVSGLDVLSRDAKRYRTYFPSLTVIAPD